MRNTVITIGRQYGSGGHLIGEILAKKLGYAYYDKQLIELAVEKSGISTGIAEGADEKATNPWLYAAMSQTGQTNFNVAFSANDALFAAQSEVIHEIGKKENAVIVGRCSDYILKNDDVNLFTVYVYAPLEARVRRTMERDKVDADKAAALIKRNDKQRKCYYDFYTDRKWAAHINYDITINSERFGLEKSAEIILNAINAEL